MQELAQDAWSLAGPDVAHHVGGMAWSHSHVTGRDHTMRRHLWEDGGRVAAWAWLYLPGSLEWQVDPRRPELLDAVLDWFEHAAHGEQLTTSVLESDLAGTEILRSRGYRKDSAAPYFAYMLRDLKEVGEPAVPPGYRVRAVAEGDAAQRLAVHQAAWESTRVSAESYQALRRTWPYRQDLDCVAETPAGAFAASALVWLDPRNLVGEVEPVGTDPAFRRQGLGRAVNLFALQQLREAGASQAIVLCRGDAAYPIPKLLYESVGFEQYNRNYIYTRPLARRRRDEIR